MSPARDHEQTAAQLRREFDLAFAQAPQTVRAGFVDLLLVRAAERPYALRLAEIAGVHPDRRVVAVPTPDPRLRGLTGLRGGVAPVFDLALTLGHARASEPRWLIELRSPKPCALAFAVLDGHLRLPEAQLAPTPHDAGLHRLATGNALTPDGPVPVIDLLAVYAEVGRLADREKEGRLT